MKTLTAFCLAATVLTAILYQHLDKGVYLTLAITFGTTAYHLGMRLTVGLFYNIIMKNQADYTKRWYQIRPWENRLYRFLRVKTWKRRLPAYAPEMFSNKMYTWEKIAQVMCQSELVHETNILFSFIPLIASVYFGSFYVFLITSVCGALFDLLFVIVQRYNRPRVIKAALREKNSRKK